MSDLPPSGELYLHYQQAFDLLNQRLFDEQLPACVLGCAAKGRSLGYFTPEGWQGRGDKPHSIDLNPELFHEKTETVVMVLVRCMLSLWEYAVENRQTRRGYYSKQYQAKARALGIMMEERPGSGGQTFTNKLTPDSPLATLLKELPKERYFPLAAEARPVRPAQKKVVHTYICGKCYLEVTGPPEMKSLRCSTPKCATLRPVTRPGDMVVTTRDLLEPA